jgi:hypothetical protein
LPTGVRVSESIERVEAGRSVFESCRDLGVLPVRGAKRWGNPRHDLCIAFRTLPPVIDRRVDHHAPERSDQHLSLEAEIVEGVVSACVAVL